MTDQELIDVLCDIERGLKQREVDFIDDLGRQLAKMRSAGDADRFALTDHQRKWAEEILSRFE